VKDPVTPKTLGAVRGEVQFDDVKFSYSRGEPVLQGLSFTVAPGEMVGIAGPTGAGKSTIVKLLARFYDPSSGRVLLDGTDLRELDPAVFRGHLGYLPQEPYLFSGTIRYNVTYGRPQATDREVEAATRAVGAHDGISRLSDSYQHVVGERGGGLPAGLRQLVCLARAFLMDPAIVLLDEATAKLDLATEMRVLDAIRAVARGRTTVMIAHRLQTAMIADYIAVVDDGQIVEWGSHHQLLAAGERYAELFRASALVPDRV
jgi:ATP-binding cassette subfamily B protein